jgi:hypothetical protein
MTVFGRVALVAIFSTAVAQQVAAAGCTTDACPDEATLTSVRSLIAAACDCEGAKKHKAYVKCAKQVARAAVADSTLPSLCQKPAVKCENNSTCGFRKAAVCCALKGQTVKAKLMKTGGKCRGGTSCTSKMALADACTLQATCAPSRPARVFRSVQKVFSTSCALPSCHSSFARQGGLVLDSEEVSYASLVGRPAFLDEAKAQGLLRVKPRDPEGSFLIRKLRAQGPGAEMPQGYPALSEPVIGMIEDWIRRGAHTTSEECPNRCSDEEAPVGDYVWHPLEPLEPPAPTEGIQLYVPQRDVTPGTEWETCYAFRPDWAGISSIIGTAPVIREQVYRMHQGSHHLLLYAYFGAEPEKWPTGFFPCVAANCINDSDCPSDAGRALLPIGGTQVAGTRYTVEYPPNVGVPLLSQKTVLIANLHYTNPFQPPQPIYGEAWLNLYFHKPGDFKVLLDGIFAINFRDLFVEPYTSRTISSIWKPRSLLTRTSEDAAIFQLFGHMHKRGANFQIDFVKGGRCSASPTDNPVLCGRDDDCACKPWQTSCTPGQTCIREPGAEDSTIYYTDAWDHAPVIDFPSPYFFVNKDQGLRWTCTHVNGVPGDPTRPPKTCREHCPACGWDDTTRTCVFDRGVELGIDTSPRVYAEGDPMPLVFGELADDDMCNMFGYFIHQGDLARIGH